MPDTSYDNLQSRVERALELIPEQIDEAQQIAHDVLAAAQTDGQHELAARALYVLGFAHYHLLTYTEAFTYLDQAQQLLTQHALSLPDLEVRILNIHAITQRQLGDFGQSAQYYERLLKVADQADDIHGKMIGLNGLAALCANTQDYDKAMHYQEQVIELAQKRDDSFVIAMSMGNLCHLYLETGAFEQAVVYGEVAIASLREAGRMSNGYFAFNSLAKAYEMNGQIEQARAMLNEALSIAEANQSVIHQLHTQHALGNFLWRQGDDRAAEFHLQKSIEIAGTANNVQINSAYDHLAQIYAARGDYQAAYTYMRTFAQLTQAAFTEEAAQQTRAFEARYQTKLATEQATHYRQRTQELEQQRLNEQRRFEATNQLRDALISDAMHDLKNPLTNIPLSVEFLRRLNKDANPRFNHHLQRIEDATDLMTYLIRDMLDLLRSETEQSVPIVQHPVQFLLDDLEQAFAEQVENKQITLVCSPTELAARYNAEAMLRVMHNLVSNAIKYSLEGGTVHIFTRETSTHVEIIVEDTGHGIMEADLHQIFNRFFRSSQHIEQGIEGTGLGLAIVKTIVSRHNGYIDVSSTPNVGSRFTVGLPKQAEGVA